METYVIVTQTKKKLALIKKEQFFFYRNEITKKMVNDDKLKCVVFYSKAKEDPFSKKLLIYMKYLPNLNNDYLFVCVPTDPRDRNEELLTCFNIKRLPTIAAFGKLFVGEDAIGFVHYQYTQFGFDDSSIFSTIYHQSNKQQPQQQQQQQHNTNMNDPAPFIASAIDLEEKNNVFSDSSCMDIGAFANRNQSPIMTAAERNEFEHGIDTRRNTPQINVEALVNNYKSFGGTNIQDIRRIANNQQQSPPSPPPPPPPQQQQQYYQDQEIVNQYDVLRNMYNNSDQYNDLAKTAFSASDDLAYANQQQRYVRERQEFD